MCFVPDAANQQLEAYFCLSCNVGGVSEYFHESLKGKSFSAFHPSVGEQHTVNTHTGAAGCHYSGALGAVGGSTRCSRALQL